MTRAEFISQTKAVEKAFRRFLTALCCGDSSMADDIAQEAFLKAYVALGTLNSDSGFRAWIYRIGYNTFLSDRRAARPHTGYDTMPAMCSEERADEAFRYQELYAALDRLPPKERTSVLLYYMEGYRIKEIAALEGVSEEAVKQHLSRGRSHLRAILAPENR